MSTAIAVKEKGILFSGEMVRAILEGRKTQTRRAMKPQPFGPTKMHPGIDKFFEASWKEPRMWWGVPAHINDSDPSPSTLFEIKCPYGVGMRLWVRECWGLHDTEPSDGPENAHIYYRATDGQRHELRYQKWRPSLFMPRWASRITLEITNIKVERLNDISEEDAKAEGMVFVDHGTFQHHPQGTPVQHPGWHWNPEVAAKGPEHCLGAARWAFGNLWEHINGRESWDANPWVFAVTFRRIDP